MTPLFRAKGAGVCYVLCVKILVRFTEVESEMTKKWFDAAKNLRELYVKCDCHSPEHMFILSYYADDDDWDTLDFAIHLNSWKNIIRRIWTAIKYIFGYKSRYGEWDNVCINPAEAKRIAEFCLSYASEYEDEDVSSN